MPQVITQKVVRKQDCITAVNRSHPAYTGFSGMPGASSAAGAGNGAASSSGRGGGGGGGGSKVQIEYCFRAPSSLRPVFGEAALRDKERLYSEGEVCEALAGYAAAQGAAALAGCGDAGCCCACQGVQMRRREVSWVGAVGAFCTCPGEVG